MERPSAISWSSQTHGRIISMGLKLSAQTSQVLTTMASRPTDRHYGLELADEAGLPKGSIYPMLARLERDGLVTSEWEEIDETKEGRRRRRYYALTGKGAVVAVSELERLRDRAKAIERGLPELRRLHPELGGRS